MGCDLKEESQVPAKLEIKRETGGSFIKVFDTLGSRAAVRCRIGQSNGLVRVNSLFPSGFPTG